MQHYPDLLNNPDNDPRITQQQYEDWYREQGERDEELDGSDEQSDQRDETGAWLTLAFLSNP